MAEKNLSQSDGAIRVDYAFWDVPGGEAGSSPRVIYSLQLFHEIDFTVNEGYRKIPHGGIETAGLLFGSVNDKEIRIEAFRPIACEHASGPSLNFSDHDLSMLEAQLLAAGTDRELLSHKPIGWFLGHTRGPLELTDTDAAHFQRFFPEPFRVTVLVKPERFQPTRFGFLVRASTGEMPRDASGSAVILPLPGRSFKAGELVPSLTAPKASNRVRRPINIPEPEAEITNEDPVESLPMEPVVAKPIEPQKLVEAVPAVDAAAEEEEPTAAPQRPANREERRRLARERARLIDEAYAPASLSPAPAQTQFSEITLASSMPPVRPLPLPAMSLPAMSMDMVRYVPSAYDHYHEEQTAAKTVLNPRSITALALAALLGCLVGYIGYLQLPAPVIPIDVRPVDQTIVVSWPPEETQNAVYAAIRLNDGAPVPLTAQEKRLGHVSLSADKDFKVEIVARNWIRDSRGIVRYMHSINGSAMAVPSYEPPSP
jgi:hypothetical protein